MGARFGDAGRQTAQRQRTVQHVERNLQIAATCVGVAHRNAGDAEGRIFVAAGRSGGKRVDGRFVLVDIARIGARRSAVGECDANLPERRVRIAIDTHRQRAAHRFRIGNRRARAASWCFDQIGAYRQHAEFVLAVAVGGRREGEVVGRGVQVAI